MQRSLEYRRGWGKVESVRKFLLLYCLWERIRGSGPKPGQQKLVRAQWEAILPLRISSLEKPASLANPPPFLLLRGGWVIP